MHRIIQILVYQKRFWVLGLMNLETLVIQLQEDREDLVSGQVQSHFVVMEMGMQQSQQTMST